MSQKGNYEMNPIAKKKFEILDAVFKSKDGCSVNELAEMLNEMGKLYQDEIYWKKRCDAAEKYIEESPCDPDIYPAQLVAYQEWNRIKDFGCGIPSV